VSASACTNSFDRTLSALCACEVDTKLALVFALAQDADREALDWDVGFEGHAPESPGRPIRPELVELRLLKRRSITTAPGHAALLHAIAHIEFNAINLALDAICRFPGFPTAFYRDWLHVAAEEATHFKLLRDHLRLFGHEYGDFPAHNGLWEMAVKTAHDPLARMALVPRVLEARGLDASPGIMRRLQAAGDARGAEIIAIILRDEVGHVAIGSRWFSHICVERGLEPEATFRQLLLAYDAPRAVLPLNIEARRQARFSDREIAAIEAGARERPRARSD
jgi:uncharacterized ferritin-like protein (DUF455 family)